ncbi:MAG: aspartate/glutamate racemase family protein [Acidiferrobacterales bacterium]|nr:aspartate/glutamate racemase family protein [Acidiferrobacterales bacterium]
MHTSKLALISLGDRATMYYLREITHLYQRRFGSDEFCPLVLKKTNFKHAINSSPNSDFRLFDEDTQVHFENAIEAQKIILPSIDLHRLLIEKPQGDFNYDSVINPIEATISKLQHEQCEQVMLFTTRFANGDGYLKSRFSQSGIEVLLPHEGEQVFLDIFREKVNTFSETAKEIEQYRDLLSNYAKENCVVTACAEFSIATLANNTNVLDMARTQIEEAVNTFE